MYDLVILGAGPAGYVAAERAGALGKSVCLIEAEELGGVCLNWGCIPTKALLASAKLYYQATHGGDFGLEVERAVFNLERAMARKGQIQGKLRQGIAGLMRKFKVEVVRGCGAITGPRTVTVDGTAYEGRNLMIATGSRPARPPIPGIDQAHVLDSTGILQIASLPRRLVVVGGGVIGVEFACFFASVGVEVTVVEMMPEICPGIDLDCARALRKDLGGKGVAFHLGAKVLEIGGDAVQIQPASGEAVSLPADMVLMATGRVPNSDNIGLETIGVEIDRRAIRVDDRLRTNIPNVYACGDVNARSMLAHSASRMAEVAVNDMFGRPDTMRYKAIPGVVYTSPEVAVVGRSAAGCQRDGIPHRVAKWPFAANGRFLAEHTGSGFAKVVIHGETDQVLGVHMVGAACSEMIHAAALMIEQEVRVEELKQTVFPHPTASEAVRDALFSLH